MRLESFYALSTKRIGYIDIAKHIAIAFIIIGHTGIVFSSTAVKGGVPPEMVKLAYTFHLPVFFIASGYFFSESKTFSFDFLRKDMLALLRPYAITALLIIAGCTATAAYHNLDPLSEFIRWGQAAIWGGGGTSPLALWDVERIGGIWFLWALFWAHITLVISSKMNEWTRLVFLSILTVIASISAQSVWLPCSIQSGIGCAVFLYAGMLARKHGMFYQQSIPKLAFIVFAIMWAYVIVNGGGMSMAMQAYPLGFIDAIGGIAAAAIVFTGSRKIEEYVEPLSKFVQWIGRNTLAIFCMHIVEDNMFHWWEIGSWYSNALGNWEFTWIIVLLVRFAVDAFLVALMYSIPGLRMIYFPQIRKIKNSGDEAAIALANSWWKYVATGTIIASVVFAVIQLLT